MNKRIASLFSVVIIIAFMGYILVDSLRGDSEQSEKSALTEGLPEDTWEQVNEIDIADGRLTSVTCGPDGKVYLGGDSFIVCLNSDLTREWDYKTGFPVTSLSAFGDTIFAASAETINLIGYDGNLIDEWGPFETGSIITSVSSNRKYVAFADAGTKRVFVLDKSGRVQSMMGQGEEQFIIPSPYFDIALGKDDTLYTANTGKRRIETWNLGGNLLSYFGESGSAPEAFCGCCNPAHFALFAGGFITAEKGLNRIKIVERNGTFTEFVTSRNSFTASVPLDIASFGDNTIYAANPGDSKLYIFRRKDDKN